jgi:hypothetical protein
MDPGHVVATNRTDDRAPCLITEWIHQLQPLVLPQLRHL